MYIEMRRIGYILLASAAVGAFPSAARQLTPGEALARAAGGFGQRVAAYCPTAPRLTLKDNKGNNCVYLFGGGTGFMLLSADDCSRPVLGYGDAPLGSEPLPEPMRLWLETYREQISAAIAAGAPAYREETVAAERHDIPVLISSRWDQSSPFSDLCPPFSAEENCVSGCVATAAAQIMYLHRYPEQGRGTHTYTDEICGKEVTLTADFGSSRYDWASMADVYDESASEASRQAVARLLADLGVSMEMDYNNMGQNSSSATLMMAAKGLIDNFNYSPALYYEQKQHYTEAEWADKLYAELSEGRPLLYEGHMMLGGHAFICDGYEAATGMFHFNWGYSASGDGYYALTALTPEFYLNPGITMDYTSNQAAIFGIRPPRPGDETKVNVVADGNITGGEGMRNDGGELSVVTRYGTRAGFINSIPQTRSEYWQGVEFVSPADGTSRYVAEPDLTTLEMNGRTQSVSVSLSSSEVPAGDYKAYAVVCADLGGKPSGNWTRVHVPDRKEDSIDVHVGRLYSSSGNSMSDKMLLTATGVDVPQRLQSGEEFTLTPSVKCQYEVFEDEIMAMIVAPDGSASILGQSEPIKIGKRVTKTVSIPCKVPVAVAEGSYLCLATGTGQIFYEMPAGQSGVKGAAAEDAVVRYSAASRTLTVGGLKAGGCVSVCGMSGMTVASVKSDGATVEIDCSGWAPGIYLVSADDNKPVRINVL